MIRLPGFIDICTNIPSGKWRDASRSALRSGYTAIIAAMPEDTLFRTENDADSAASEPIWDSCIDFAQIAAVKPDNVREMGDWSLGVPSVLARVKEPNPDNVFGQMKMLTHLFNHWPQSKPICIQGKDELIGSPLFLAQTKKKHVHVCSVVTRKEIELIREAKESGCSVSFDVNPLSLLLSRENAKGREPLERLGSEDDRHALIENLGMIDCFSMNGMKETASGSFGHFSLMLPVLLTLLQRGLLKEEDIAMRCSIRPRSIFGLYPQSDTEVLIDEDIIQKNKEKVSGRPVLNPVMKVSLRGNVLYDNETAEIPGGTIFNGHARRLKGYR